MEKFIGRILIFKLVISWLWPHPVLVYQILFKSGLKIFNTDQFHVKNWVFTSVLVSACLHRIAIENFAVLSMMFQVSSSLYHVKNIYKLLVPVGPKLLFCYNQTIIYWYLIQSHCWTRYDGIRAYMYIWKITLIGFIWEYR